MTASRKSLQWARDMVKAGNVPASAQAENGDTFHLQFGSGKLGMMGTGNFNITLANDQMKGHEFEFGIANLPGVEPGSSASFIGGDLVVIPNGSERVDDAVEFMKFILSDNEQVEGYAKLLNLTTRTDMADNKYFQAEPLVQDVAKALEVGTTPYTLTFFEQINSPQGPWLQMLQRAYYTDDDLDTVIADAKQQMKDISCSVTRTDRSTAAPSGPRRILTDAPRPTTRPSWRSDMHRTRRDELIGFLFLAPALLFVLVFTAYPARPDGLDLVQQLVADHAPEVRRHRQLRAGVRRRPVLGVAAASASSTPCSSPRS